MSQRLAKKIKFDLEHNSNILLNSFNSTTECATKLLTIEQYLSHELKKLDFSELYYVYNPLEYTNELHEPFYRKFLSGTTKKYLFLGLNPGPYGMAQTGIPFGYTKVVKEWFQLSGNIGKPDREHHKKPILGLKSQRIEQSGLKFWGLMRERCGTPEIFFKDCFVYNYCPLVFLDDKGINVTPNSIKCDKDLKKKLFEICDTALLAILKALDVQLVVAIGRIAETQTKNILQLTDWKVKVDFIMHPSPLNRKAKNWKNEAEEKLNDLGILTKT